MNLKLYSGRVRNPESVLHDKQARRPKVIHEGLYEIVICELLESSDISK